MQNRYKFSGARNELQLSENMQGVRSSKTRTRVFGGASVTQVVITPGLNAMRHMNEEAVRPMTH